MRTIMCPCGWTTRSQLREANSRYKLHIKYCKFEGVEIVPFDPNMNGIGGITATRHGNKVQKPLQYSGMVQLEKKDYKGLKIK